VGGFPREDAKHEHRNAISRGDLMYILGISAFYHDSAACLVQNGEIIAAAQEERFTRKKHDPGFPCRAVQYCLSHGGIGIKDLQYIVFYDKPLIKFERLMETYVGFAPKGIQSFLAAMPVWLKEKLLLRNLLQKEILACSTGLQKPDIPELLFGEHHESHAASAFFASPYQRAGVLCMDGVGEWANTSAWLGEGNIRLDCSTPPLPTIRGLRSTLASIRSWGWLRTASPSTSRRSMNICSI
jgi:carbamoyltransferase